MDGAELKTGGALALDALFAPVRIGALDLRNRIVMAPMTRNFSPGGIPGDDMLAYYRRRAEGGVGLIVTEGVYVAHRSTGDATRVPRLESAATVAAWRRIADAVHAAGALIIPQLWHIGLRPSRAPIDASVRLLGPSGLDGDGRLVDKPMTEREIAAVIDAFRHSAAMAKEAGFDGVEIHGAHGYLIDQFLWDGTNRRTDAYGGDLVRRARFAADITREIRAEVGPDFPVWFRFSQWKISALHARIVETPAELETLLGLLVDAGVDVFDCSQQRFWDPTFPESGLNLAGWAKKLTGRPVMTVGYIGTGEEVDGIAPPGPPERLATLIGMIERGEVDLAGVGRSLIADPDWPQIVRSGRFEARHTFSRPESRQVLA